MLWSDKTKMEVFGLFGSSAGDRQDGQSYWENGWSQIQGNLGRKPVGIWQDVKTAVHKHSPSNLTELELLCKEEWAKMSVSGCAKLKRLAAVIAVKGGSTKY